MRELFKIIKWENGITPEFQVDASETAFILQYDEQFFSTVQYGEINFIVCPLIDNNLINDNILEEYVYNIPKVDKNNLPKHMYRSVCGDKEGFIIIK